MHIYIINKLYNLYIIHFLFFQLMAKYNKVYSFLKTKIWLIIIIIIFIRKQDIILKNNRPLIMKKLYNRSNITKQQLNNKKLLIAKEELLKYISLTVGKEIKFVKYIFIGNNLRFGNKMFLLYKIIFYCQILRCKKIFLDKKKVWFIKNKIINKKYKMIIIPEEEKNIKTSKKNRFTQK